MKNFEKLKSDVHFLMDQGDYPSAKNAILSAIEMADKKSEDYIMFLATSAGLFIDLGFETYDKEAAEAGVKILTESEEYFNGVLSKQSYNYCFANGMSALYRIQKNQENVLPTLEMVKPFLAQAKNYYFKAYKEIDLSAINGIDLQILTNLGNNLSNSGRIIEAIRLYNSVLKVNPDFAQSLIGCAENLDYWLRISFCPNTISLYLKVFTLFEKGLHFGLMPPNQTAYSKTQREKYRTLLSKAEFDFSNIEQELKLNAEEYEQHSSLRKFCINNYLTLNEHSNYCNCSAASNDDLSIVHEGISVYGDKVGKMELLLNRLKSEFHMARKLYFEGISNLGDSTEVLFSELMDREKISEEVEKVRTSFRLCFGIFDKIAHGLCYFFELPQKENENIYFESFWNTKRCLERWEKLKEMRNPHLVALYSIANDFNSKEGEFAFYKQWRNKLEHNNLILVDVNVDSDLNELFTDNTFVTKVSYSTFKEQALHLLQICCAAIYSYTYAIRTESLQKGDGEIIVPFIIQPKVPDK
jgi:tetratricopeptide (TPR) repeat protein